MRSAIAVGRFLAAFVIILICLFIAVCILPFKTREKKGILIRTWSRRILRWLGVRVVQIGEVNDSQVHQSGYTPGKMGRLVVSNHISFLDIFALNSVVPCNFVAKAEIATWPVFGRITKSVDTIFIERGKKRSLLNIGERLQGALREGRTLLMFPEGTTSDGTGLLKLHANLMESAVREQADVIPMVLRYLSNGEITTAPAYVGDMGIFTCLWNVVKTANLEVHVHVLPGRTDMTRQQLCKGVSRDMSAVIGVPDPLAEKVEVESEVIFHDRTSGK